MLVVIEFLSSVSSSSITRPLAKYHHSILSTRAKWFILTLCRKYAFHSLMPRMAASTFNHRREHNKALVTTVTHKSPTLRRHFVFSVSAIVILRRAPWPSANIINSPPVFRPGQPKPLSSYQSHSPEARGSVCVDYSRDGLFENLTALTESRRPKCARNFITG